MVFPGCFGRQAGRGRGFFSTGMILALVWGLSGCATMSDDDQTKAQGTAVGAIGGAILGGGLGILAALASGGSSDQIMAGAIIGGVAGGMAGGVAGYQYGMAVAQRKAYYRESEDFYLAEIAEMEANTLALQSANQQLVREVNALEKRKSELDRALADGAIDQRTYQREFGGLRREARSIERNMRPAEEMVGYQRALLEDAEQSGTSAEVAAELSRAAQEQEATYETTEQALERLAAITQPTRG